MLSRFARYIGTAALIRPLTPRADPDREGCTPGRSSADPDMKHGEIISRLLTYVERASGRAGKYARFTAQEIDKLERFSSRKVILA